MPVGLYTRTVEIKAKTSKALLGHKVSDEARAKTGEASKRRWANPEYREKIKSRMSKSAKQKVGELNNFFGSHHTEETKWKIGQARKQYFDNPVNRARISSALKGKLKSEEHKKNLSLARQQFLSQHPDFEIKSFLGHHHSLEARAKMSEASLGHKASSAENQKRSISLKIFHIEHPDFWVGENNPNWKGGASFIPYTNIFNIHLKSKVRIRDNYTCQLCGMLEDGHKHDIHHINYNKEDCGEGNLVTLCRPCNAKVNSHRYYWESYFRSKMGCLNQL